MKHRHDTKLPMILKGNFVTCGRSVVFSGFSGFLNQLNWPPRYNWNIVESGIKHHKPKPWSHRNLEKLPFNIVGSFVSQLYGHFLWLLSIQEVPICPQFQNYPLGLKKFKILIFQHFRFNKELYIWHLLK
jgi:hypothetical protein